MHRAYAFITRQNSKPASKDTKNRFRALLANARVCSLPIDPVSGTVSLALSRIRAIRESAYAARANVTFLRIFLNFAVYAWCMPSSRFMSPWLCCMYVYSS